MTLKELNITPEAKKLCEAVIALEAYTQTLSPIINEIYQDVFDHYFPPGTVINKYTKTPITDHNQLYKAETLDLSENITQKGYYEECQLMLKDKGWPPAKPGNCPLLEAESALRDAKLAFCRACVRMLPPSISMTLDTLDTMSLKLYRDFFDICMKLVVPTIDTDKLKAELLKAH